MDKKFTPQAAGLFESALQTLFTRRAQVLEVEDIGRAFRIVTLGGDALRDVDWTPGDKLQIQFGRWVQRTYTPMDWDPAQGRTRILVYLHADGPGAQWARTLRQGEHCVLFGPRKSIRLARPQSPVILFGDETSLGLAVALSQQPQLHALFEVAAPADSAAVLDRLQLQVPDAALCTRLAGDAHFPQLETRMALLLLDHPTAEVVLTGRASAIQQISRVVRQQGVAAGRRQSKAYWAAGKTGLD